MNRCNSWLVLILTLACLSSGMVVGCGQTQKRTPQAILEFKVEATPSIVENWMGRFPKHPDGYRWYESEDEDRVLVEEKPILTNEHIIGVDTRLDPAQGNAVILKFDAIGTQLLRDLTKEYDSSAPWEHRRLAIVLDNKLLTAPSIECTIPDPHGVVVITGGAVMGEKAKNLVDTIRSGLQNKE